MSLVCDMYDCLICCDSYDESNIIICKNDCGVYMCENCFEIMIKVSNKEFILPKCPNINCKSEYYLSSLNGYDIDLVESYLESLYKNLMTLHDKKISIIDMKKKLIEEYHKSKIEYINNFPAAITKIISIAYSKKMKILKDTIKIKINEKLNKLTQICFNPLCVGKLDKNYICVLCSREYCEYCDTQKHDETHICDENILKDKEYVRGITKCPKCALPIIKSYGCDNMTCASCKTNFSYKNGTFTVAGNHTENEERLKLNTKRDTLFMLYDKYYNDPKIKELLICIDNKYLDPKDDTKLLKLLLQDKTFNNLKRIGKEYELLNNNIIEHRRYQSFVNEIEKKHKSNMINVYFLNKIFNELD